MSETKEFTEGPFKGRRFSGHTESSNDPDNKFTLYRRKGQSILITLSSKEDPNADPFTAQDQKTGETTKLNQHERLEAFM